MLLSPLKAMAKGSDSFREKSQNLRKYRPGGGNWDFFDMKTPPSDTEPYTAIKRLG